MAITNAQQYKQLMQNGGRIGLKGGGADMGAPDKAADRAATGSGGSGVFTGYNVLIGPATPPTTFSLLAVGQKQKMNLGGLYS